MLYENQRNNYQKRISSRNNRRYFLYDCTEAIMEYNISSVYELSEPLLEIYGSLDDFILVTISDNKVQLRKIIKEESK